MNLIRGFTKFSIPLTVSHFQKKTTPDELFSLPYCTVEYCTYLLWQICMVGPTEAEPGTTGSGKLQAGDGNTIGCGNGPAPQALYLLP